MKRTLFYTSLIIIAALALPFAVAGENLSSISDRQEVIQQKLQQQTEAFQQHFADNLETFKYIPAVLFLNAIVLTYCWSILNKRIQSILFFVFGFALSGPYISSFVNLVSNPNQSKETIFLIGGLIGGFIAFLTYWIGRLFSKITLFLGGAVLPVLALSLLVQLKIVEHFRLFDQINKIELILFGIISAFSGFFMLKLKQYKIVDIAASAIAGAAGIAYLLLGTSGLSNYKILNELKEEGIFVLKNLKDNNQTILFIFLAVTGIIVQAVLLAITRHYKAKSVSSAKGKDSNRDEKYVDV
jgi:hypothetical protein